ncbi:putative quinol monooxygenase [Aspergillus foveolatus]|uniref:putative quinol monooxygenase n=1 Tax=Aspergillus foveolatus TaxID=210207 RepID=UPI003CCD2ED4
MTSGHAGVSLQVTVYLNEEDVPTFLDALGSVYDEILSEENCTLFEVYQSIEDKGKNFMFKNWSASREWVTEVAMRRPYLDEYHAKTEPLFLRPKKVVIQDRLGGKWSNVKESNGNILPAAAKISTV